MEPETVLYLIMGVVIVTFIAFCYACYCTCRELKINNNSPTSSSTGGGIFAGNPRTVVTRDGPRTWSRQTTQVFRQLSWRTFMKRNRSPTLSSCSSASSSYPLIARRRASIDPGRLSPNLIAVIYDGDGSRLNLSGAPTSPSTLAPPQPHLTINLPENCVFNANTSNLYPHRAMPIDDLPTYDDAIRYSTIIMQENQNVNYADKSTTKE